MATKRTHVYRLYPDATMAHVLDQWCDYRRYCYNKALELLNLDQSSIKGKKIILGKKTNPEIASIVNFLHSKVDIYRIEEERESLEKLFIEESRS